jgi:TRAP-type C4-dicarboxylate transport system permease small subunit
MQRLSRAFDLGLQVVTLTLLIVLTVVVLMGVAFRYSGNSLIWYDEAASMLLAWITFLGAALAMNRNAHLGFNGLMFGLPLTGRLALFWVVEAIVIATFLIIGWAGWALLDVFGNARLTSLPFLERSVVQSVLPISAVLVIIARLLNLPRRLRDVRSGIDPDMVEINEEIARAEAELRRTEASR